MSGKFATSLDGFDATARKFRELERQQRELAPSIAGSITPALEYLTQGSGFVTGATTWSVQGTANTTNNAAMNPTFDSTYDLETTFIVPLSGKFTITIASWLVNQLNAYNNGASQAISMFFRFGSTSHVWYEDSGDEPAYSSPVYGGAQSYQELYGSNVAHVMGQTSTSTMYYYDWTPGSTVHVRTRRYYWAFAKNAAGTAITMPTGSWWHGYLYSLSMQIAPVYAGTGTTDEDES